MSKKDAFEFYGNLLSEDSVFSERVSSEPLIEPEDGDVFVTANELKRMRQNSSNESTKLPGIEQYDPEEEEVFTVFKTFHQPRIHKYTESEMAAIRASCDTVIVHDFSENDQYHWSDEEAAANDALNEIRVKLNGMTKVYRRIDKYILAMRTVLEAWDLLEKKYNFVHTREEFYAMVGDGSIYSSGIILPRMKGLDRYNIDLVIKYISDPRLDPKDLVPVDDLKKERARNAWYDDDEDEDYEDIDTLAARVLDKDEQALRQYYIDNPDADLPTLSVKNLNPKYVEGYDNRSVFSVKKKKKKKKVNKSDKLSREYLHPLLRKIQRNPDFRSVGRDMSMSMLISTSMFEPQEKEEHSVWDGIMYGGSWADDDSVELYELAMDEMAREEHPLGDRYMTYGDRELMEFYRKLEETGEVNVAELRRRMNNTDEDRTRTEQRQVARTNKKAESALLQRIVKLNNNPKFRKLIGKAEKALNKSTD